jgi:hypothetical protein
MRTRSGTNNAIIKKEELRDNLNFLVYKCLKKKTDEIYRVKVNITQAQYAKLKEIQACTGRFNANKDLAKELVIIKSYKVKNVFHVLDEQNLYFRIHKNKDVLDDDQKIIIKGPHFLTAKFGVISRPNSEKKKKEKPTSCKTN